MRLIDGDRLKKEIHENDIMGGLNYAWYIDHAELVDAVEVKHGEWEVVDQEEPRRYGCSVCKRLSFYMTNYCSCCGAKMDVTQSNDSNVLDALDGKEKNDE